MTDADKLKAEMRERAVATARAIVADANTLHSDAKYRGQVDACAVLVEIGQLDAQLVERLVQLTGEAVPATERVRAARLLLAIADDESDETETETP